MKAGCNSLKCVTTTASLHLFSYSVVENTGEIEGKQFSHVHFNYFTEVTQNQKNGHGE